MGVLQDPGPEMSFSDPPSETFPGKMSTKVSGNDDFTAVFFLFSMNLACHVFVGF